MIILKSKQVQFSILQTLNIYQQLKTILGTVTLEFTEVSSTFPTQICKKQRTLLKETLGYMEAQFIVATASLLFLSQVSLSITMDIMEDQFTEILLLSS